MNARNRSADDKRGIREPLLQVPGFSWSATSAGIKDDTLDFCVLAADQPCSAAGVFTRNNFPAAPVLVGREHVHQGRLQAVVVNSKNANAATGKSGIEDARRICQLLGETLQIAPELVLPSSTGVIGVPLPMARIEAACRQAKAHLASGPQAIAAFARAIMTTDTRPKAVSVKAGKAILTGVAKGAGMIEPQMATMLAFFATDAGIAATNLQRLLRDAVASTFNRISVDTDTSTNDTVVILAGGGAGEVDEREFAAALHEACLYLAKEIVRDGEGATKLIELTVSEAASEESALAIARSVINSPLVKTAIYGADPNWGRFVMAIGKVFAHPVPLAPLRILFGYEEPPLAISADGATPEILQRITEYLRGDKLRIEIRLGQGTHEETMWGCDLTEGYVRINAEYTT